jgi:hypothetical protein
MFSLPSGEAHPWGVLKNVILFLVEYDNMT